MLQVDGLRVRSHACLQALVGRWAEDAQAAAAREHEAVCVIDGWMKEW